MGMNNPHQAVSNALPDGKFWTHDDLLHTGRELRPNWESWLANSAWVPEMLEKIRLDGPKYCQIDATDLEATSESVIRQALHTAWSSMKEKWRDQQVGRERIKKDKARTKRHYSRKEAVSLRADLLYNVLNFF